MIGITNASSSGLENANEGLLAVRIIPEDFS